MVEQRPYHVMSDRRIRLAEMAPTDSLSWAPRGFTLSGAFAAFTLVAAVYGALWVLP